MRNCFIYKLMLSIVSEISGSGGISQGHNPIQIVVRCSNTGSIVGIILGKQTTGVIIGIGVRFAEIGVILAGELVLWNNGFRYCPTVIRRAVNI